MSTVKIQFASKEHRDFYFDMMTRSRKNDCYHRAFFYVMGIAPETRANIDRMFDFTHDWIEPEGMHGGWQTSGTVRSCHLAFNLWNGYTEDVYKRQAQQTVLPAEVVTAVEDCGFFESIPLWAVTLIGGLFITVLSFIMIMTVYGRFFKLYLYTAIAPVPLSTFAGEPTQNVRCV